MNNGALKHELFVCECDNVEHQLVFSYFKDEQEDEVYMEVHFNSRIQYMEAYFGMQ